jgi:hypothetical protein
MRKIITAVVSGLALGLSFCLNAGPPDDKVRLRLVDARSGKDTGGMVRVFVAGQDKPLPLPGLFDRLTGLERSATLAGWYAVPEGGGDTTLPRAKLRLEAVAGLETALTRLDVDRTAKDAGEVVVPLRFLFRPEQDGLVAGNTHLHLRGLSRAAAEEYLCRVPAADLLKVLFISYLERRADDLQYITNRFPVGDLQPSRPGGPLLSNGEEHRHNIGAFGQGYGHVMLLAIKQLVRPVSLGPGITGAGDDDRPLAPGIAEARRQGGTVIWCHNTSGHEGVPAALAGQLDALNVFDGSRTGSYEDLYYRYLNVGLRLPLSTGTDWFLYDFARVYARVPGRLTTRSWLEAVKAGRCTVTNGPLLTLAVDGRGPGDVLSFDRPRAVRVEATGVGRHDFRQLELVQNGRVIARQPAADKDGEWSARLVRDVRLEGPAWFAVRIAAATRNEFDRPLFAHSSPVYVDVAGLGVFDVEAAGALLRRLEESRADVRARGHFSGAPARERVLAAYDQAAQALRKRMSGRR